MQRKKFCDIVKRLSGHRVIPVDLTDVKDKELIAQLHRVAKETINIIRPNPINSPRPNEVGNKIERRVEQAFSILQDEEWKIDIPKNKKGRRQATGYPDFLVCDKYDRPSYLECKTYNTGKMDDTLRSFYLSSGNKIIFDARHIVISFEMKETDGLYVAKGYKLIDIAELECDLKLEWNANNRRLYNLKSL